MKLLAKQYREFYVACVNLYGAIDSDDAFVVLKKYFPDAKKEDFLKDIKTRVDKFTREYTMWTVEKTRNRFIIANEFYDSDALDSLFHEQANKDFYIPASYKEFLFAGTYEAYEKDNKTDLNKIAKILKQIKTREDPNFLFNYIFLDYKDFCIFRETNGLQLWIDRLQLWGYDFTEEQIYKMLPSIQKILNNTRIPTNRGYTPSELFRQPDLDKIQLTLGPNIRKSLIDGELDVDEYLGEVMLSELPETAKRSLIDEILKIKEIIKNKASA